MSELVLSPVGLLLAAMLSAGNVFADVARKKVMERHELVAGTLWIRVFAAIVFSIALAGRTLSGSPPTLRNSGFLFGIDGLLIAPAAAFLVYLTIDVVLISIAQILLMRALQVSPMSMCIPFMAFTPVFLIPMGYIVVGEMPSSVKLLGVGLIVVGSLVMHRRLFAEGWAAPARAIIREKGSRYILLVAFILSLTNPIEKRLILMSDPMTQAFAYGLGLCVFFALLAWKRRADCRVVLRNAAGWTVLAGVMDAGALLLQLFTFGYLAVVITISIKRAGIVLAVLAGWLIFREQEISDKLIAAAVMLGGVLVIYLPLDIVQASSLAGAVLVGMSAALYATRGAPAGRATAAQPIVRAKQD